MKRAHALQCKKALCYYEERGDDTSQLMKLFLGALDKLVYEKPIFIVTSILDYRFRII